MLKRIVQSMTLMFCTAMLIFTNIEAAEPVQETKPVEIVVEKQEIPVEVPKVQERTIDIPELEVIEEPVEPLMSNEDIELIALVTMAEAEGEPEEGKRLVIDTILNRVDSEHFPDTVKEVVYQKNQFTSMWNGRVDRCYVNEDICQLVREELQERTNHETVFFMVGKFGKYGEPLFQVGNHYFSSYA